MSKTVTTKQCLLASAGGLQSRSYSRRRDMRIVCQLAAANCVPSAHVVLAGAGGRGGATLPLPPFCDTAWQAVVVAAGTSFLLFAVTYCRCASRLHAKNKKASRLRDHPNLSAAEYDKLQKRLTDTYEQRIRARGPPPPACPA